MALFGGKEEKEAKAAAKAEELLQRYGLNNISDPQTLSALRSISTTLTGAGMMEIGTALTGNAADKIQAAYLRTIVEQNFILIRQLDKLTGGR